MSISDFFNIRLKNRTKPSNARLISIFTGIDKVVIKEGGVYENKAMSDQVVLTISEMDLIENLKNLLMVDENKPDFYCMCHGDYAIELYKKGRRKAIIGFHHGVSIRYDDWGSDAELIKSEELLQFLFNQGLKEPLADRIESKRQMEDFKIARQKWLDISPKAFNKYMPQIGILDYDILPQLLEDLNVEIPNQDELIIVLLQTLGTTNNFWSPYPAYEEFPKEVLNIFEIADIINSYSNSDRNDTAKKGLGRFLFSFEFTKNHPTYLDHVSLDMINELEIFFQQFGDERAIKAVSDLHKKKINHIL